MIETKAMGRRNHVHKRGKGIAKVKKKRQMKRIEKKNLI